MKSFLLSVAKKSGHYLVSSTAITILSAISVPIYTRLFPPIEMGYYYIVITVASLVSIPMGLTMESGVARYYYEHHNDKSAFKRFISTYLLFGLFWGGFIWFGIGSLPMSLWTRYLDPVYLPYLTLALAIGFLQTYVALVTTIIRVGLSSKLLASVNFVNAVLIFGLTLLLSAALHMGIRGRMLAQIIVPSGVVIYLLFYMYRSDMLTFAFDWPYLKEGFKFSLPLIPESSMAWISCLSDRLLLGFFKFSASVGTYALGYDLSRMIISLLGESTFQAYGPIFYREMKNDPESFKSKHNKFYTHYLLLLSFATLALTLFSKEIMFILAPKSYSKSIVIIQIIAYAALMGSAYKPFFVALSFFKRTYLISTLAFISAMTNLGLNIWLIPRYGSIGAAWSTFATVFLYAFLGFLFSQRELPIAYEYNRLAKIIVTNLCCVGVFFAIWMQSYSYPIILLTKVLCMVAYPLLLWAIGYLSTDELRLIKRLSSIQGIQNAWHSART